MNQSKDNLEDFFQQSFNDMEKVNQPADWNNPSEAVWGNIQDGLTEEKRSNVFLLKWPWSAIAASYLLIVGGYQFFQKKEVTNDLNSAIVAIEEQFKIDRSSKSPDLPVSIQAGLETLSMLSTDSKTAYDFGRQETTSILISSLETRNIEDLAKKGIAAIEHNEFNLIKSIDNELIIGDLTSVDFERKTIDETNTLPIFTSSITSDPRALEMGIVPSIKEKKATYYLTANYTTVTEKLKSDAKGFAQKESTKGRSIGMDIGRANENGWAVETGVYYTKMDQRTFESSNTEIAQIPQKEYLDIPLTVKKKWKMGKLGLSVKTGLVNRFELNRVAEHIGNEPINEDTRNLQPNKYLPSVVAGVGLEYMIQPNLAVYVEPTVSKGIRSVADLDGAELMAENLMVQVGVRYELD